MKNDKRTNPNANHAKLTAIELAAITLRYPFSGTEWLDRMIEQSREYELDRLIAAQSKWTVSESISAKDCHVKPVVVNFETTADY